MKKYFDIQQTNVHIVYCSQPPKIIQKKQEEFINKLSRKAGERVFKGLSSPVKLKIECSAFINMDAIS